MKFVSVNGKQYRLPSELNSFQQELYVHLIDWKWANISKEPGVSHNQEFDAILPDSFERNGTSPLIYHGVADKLEAHRKKNDFRIHQHFYHMASSQAANINLFLPVLHHSAVNSILREIKPDFASLTAQELDNGYCIEFWGGNFDKENGGTGVLGDESKISGTDSDIAIAYHNHDGELCLWLIEHKLTEKEFTVCGGFKSENRKNENKRKISNYDCSTSFSDILKNKNLCYYHGKNGFHYWDVTDEHQSFFINHTSHASCPFRGGMNQLWRNQLLALALEKEGKFKHVFFSVVKHPGNTSLDKTLRAYQNLINNNQKFGVFTSAEVLRAAERYSDPHLSEWINWYKALYKVS